MPVLTVEIFGVVERQGIAIAWRNLGSLYWGIYMADYDTGSMCIVLHGLLRTDERMLRVVVCHELGHHFRSTGSLVVAASRSGVYHVCKGENLANDWAVDFLVPGDEFLRVAAENRSLEEMCDHFYVTEDFIAHRARKIYENGLRTRQLKRYFDNQSFRLIK